MWILDGQLSLTVFVIVNTVNIISYLDGQTDDFELKVIPSKKKV